MRKIYFAHLLKSASWKNNYSYPCEDYTEEILKGRKILVKGPENRIKDSIKNYLKDHQSILVDNDVNCTDVIILPIYNSNNDCSANNNYFVELDYYHDIIESCRLHNHQVQNVVVCVPYGSAQPSISYKNMADFSVIPYVEGLSLESGQSSTRYYIIELDEHVEISKLIKILLYLISNNSNHFIGHKLVLK